MQLDLCSIKQELDLYYPFSHTIGMSYKLDRERLKGLKGLWNSAWNCAILLQQLSERKNINIQDIKSLVDIYHDKIIDAYREMLTFAKEELGNNTLHCPSLPVRDYSLDVFIEDVRIWHAGHSQLLNSTFPDVIRVDCCQDDIDDSDDTDDVAVLKNVGQVISQMLKEVAHIMHFLSSSFQEHVEIYTALAEEMKREYPDVQFKVRGYELLVERFGRVEVIGYKGLLKYFNDLHSSYRVVEFNLETVRKVVRLLITVWDVLDELNEELQPSAESYTIEQPFRIVDS